MIGRRGFALGLGSMLLAGPAAADVSINGVKQEEPQQTKKKDIPFTPLDQIPNHRQYMRDIVIALAAYARARNPNFAVLARNAPELLIKEKREYQWQTLRDPDGAEAGKYSPIGTVNRPYLRALTGMLIDGLVIGAEDYGKPTSAPAAELLSTAAATAKGEGGRILDIEYCVEKAAVDKAMAGAAAAGALTYIDRDGDKELGQIPREVPAHENPAPIRDLASARNFLPMLDSHAYGRRADWVQALRATNYDVLVLDPFWQAKESLSFDDIKSLRFKRLGSDRMVLASLPIGRARDTRFYWKPDWHIGAPNFLLEADPDDPSQSVVRYWDDKWKEILGLYMQGIVDLGVDGVVLDQIDAYLHFEEMMPLQ